MTPPRRFLLAGSHALALLGLSGCAPRAQPADETAAVMNTRLAAATISHAGPSYLYPDHATGVAAKGASEDVATPLM